MPNTLGLYDPLFYAQEALRALEKALGMAASVYRGYEPTPTQKGSTIKINRPSTFTAADMPVAATDLAPTSVDLVVDQWKGVTFQLTDKELAFTKEKIIEDHIRPAAYAVADAIDLSLVALYKDVPHVVAADSGSPEFDFPNLIAKMFDNKVPKDQRTLMMNGAQEAAYLKRQIFVSAEQASNGGEAQREGALGRKFGFSLFSNQNVPNHVVGTLDGTAMLVNANTPIASLTVVIKDTDNILTGTIKKGDAFTITTAGVTYAYAAAVDATAAANLVTLTIADPRGLVVAAVAADVVARTTAANKAENIAAHRNAFALGMAPLSEIGGMLGAKIATIADPITGLALRSRMWYDGDNARVKVGIDALWGVKTLDGHLAVRLRS